MKKFFIAAGEISGDRLGAGLIEELKKDYPDAQFRGLGGQAMKNAGLFSIFPMEEISHMGIFEVLKHLPNILKRRKELIEDALIWKPDVMIGIDSPDFNLTIENKLKKAGIKTLHYVSPSVWAWRQKRVEKIKQSVDGVLTLLPFEANFYKAHNVNVKFVGHPLADSIALNVDKRQAKFDLDIKDNDMLVAILPGSREGEIHKHSRIFLEAAVELQRKFRLMHGNRKLIFVIPSANANGKEYLQDLARNYKMLNLKILEPNNSTLALSAADAALVASGTATLEAMLTKTPMVISYKVSPLSYFVLKHMIKIGFVGLPNLLAGKLIVKERLQNMAEPRVLADDIFAFIENPSKATNLINDFSLTHRILKKGANRQVADAVIEVMGKTSNNKT